VTRARNRLLARLRARGLTPVVAAVACATAPASAGVPQTLLLLVRRQLADGFSSVPNSVLGLAASTAGVSMMGKWLCATVVTAATRPAPAGGVGSANAGQQGTAPAGKEQPPTPARGARPDVGRGDSHGDPLPAGAVARLGTVRLRHGGAIGAA